MPNWVVHHDRLTTKGRLLFVLFGLFLLITIFYNIKVDDSEFAVVVDAGSSGSRAHIFTYQQTYFLPVIRQIDSIKTNPGISSIQDINDIKRYLIEILQFASKTVPKSLRSKTPILFYATAGMRLLPISNQNEIMKAACVFFMENSEFYIPNCQNFKVISGLDEGIYGWLSVNYLKKALSRKVNPPMQTFGFLDMGGASLQIAFDGTDVAQAHQDDLKEVELFLRDGSILSYKLFVTTYLGFGANEARRTYLANYLSPALKNKTSEEILDDCLMKGHKVNEDGLNLEGTGNYDLCIKKVSAILNNGMPCPDSPCYFNGVHIPISNFSELNLVGVSEFYYTSTNVYDLGGLYNSTAFLSNFDSLCSSNWNDSPFAKPNDNDKAVDYNCFKSSWIYNFLHLGLRISTQPNKNGKSSLEFVNEIGNVELSWTLGAILMFICSNNIGKIRITPLRHWTLGLIFLFLGFMLLFYLYHYSKRWFANPSYNSLERRIKNSGHLTEII